MFDKFVPDMYFKNIYAIDYKSLKKKVNIKIKLCDILLVLNLSRTYLNNTGVYYFFFTIIIIFDIFIIVK